MTNNTTTQPTTERYYMRYIDRIGAHNKRFFDVGTGETVENRAAELAAFWGAETIIELGPLTSATTTTARTTAQLTAQLAARMGAPELSAAEILFEARRRQAREDFCPTAVETLQLKALEIQAVADARIAAIAPVPALSIDPRSIVTRRSGYARPGSASTRTRWAYADPRGTAASLRNLRDKLV